MQKKIQNSMVWVIITTLVIAYTITIFFVYGNIRTLAKKDINHEASYLATSLNLYGEDMVSSFDAIEPGRITLIASSGAVIYDSEEKASDMENHSDRPEVKAAIENGVSEYVRRSSSLGIELFYSAVRLDNGDIIRISKPVKTAFSTALTFLPVMIIIGLVMIFAAYLLSRREAKRLVDPINKINLDEPLKNKTYPELTPLLYRIEKQNKAKEELADMRREFSANVSHELKTPLTSISGYAEIMRDGLVKPEDITEFSSRIYNEANRLLVLINDIIRLSELDEGKVELEKENVDLFDLSKDIVTRLSEKARKNDIKLSLSGTHCTVYGIHRILDEMIYNITDNAIKYNNKGGNVSIWSGSTPEGIYVIVEDDGIGIPEEEQEHIFERFYRVDKSRSKALGGTGLGLSIVKHGAKLHNAQIKVNSEPGVGTKMSLIFPNQ